MTIAAAFPCQEGLILCADTQEDIGGYVKGDTEKMHVLPMDGYSLVVTGAGDGELIQTTVSEVKLFLEKRQPDTINEIESAIRLRLLQSFKDHVTPYATFPKDDRPSMELLIGIHCKKDSTDTDSYQTKLYRMEGTLFRPAPKAECVGTGLLLAQSLIDQYFSVDLSLRHASLVALYILRQAKRWVQFCGGNSDVLLLSNKSKEIKRIPTDQVKSLERHFDEFGEQLKPVLIACADIDFNPKDFETLLSRFSSNMHTLQGKIVSDHFMQHMQNVFLAGWSGEKSPEISKRKGKK